MEIWADSVMLRRAALLGSLAESVEEVVVVRAGVRLLLGLVKVVLELPAVEMEQVVWEMEEGERGGVFLEMEERLARGGTWGVWG